MRGDCWRTADEWGVAHDCSRAVAGRTEALSPASSTLSGDLRRRDDGYHELESLMVPWIFTIAWNSPRTLAAESVLECDDPTLPVDGKNLVVRAAEKLKADSGFEGGAKISLIKTIPAQAGLAGGSSDAATTLVALDRLWNLTHPKHGWRH